MYFKTQPQFTKTKIDWEDWIIYYVYIYSYSDFCLIL